MVPEGLVVAEPRSDQLLKNIQASHVRLGGAIQAIAPHAMPFFEVKRRLLDLYESIFQHLSLQRNEFYESLRLMAGEDQQKLTLIDSLERDLTELRIKTFWFSDEHRADMSDQSPGNLVADFREFSSAVAGRLRTEEELLFPMLGHCSKGKQGDEL